MIYFLILIGALILLFVFDKKFIKHLKLGNLVLVTGGVKTGKSTLAVNLTIKQYKRNLRFYKIRCFFVCVFKIFKPDLTMPEKPLLYSNVPLNVKYGYVPLTEKLLKRESRFAYKSVIYINEASLIADSMFYKDMVANEQLLLFNKLIAHSTKGGYLIYDTQSIQDCHFAIKRCLNNYFNIHHCVKVFPFFVFLKVREMFYSDDGSVINIADNDIEFNNKWVCVPKSTWKKFDCYCYSVLTDNLPIEKNVVIAKSLKADTIVSFKKFYTIKESEKNV